MGKLYSYTYVSLDGVVESPEAWVAPFFGEELADDLTRRLSAAAAMVLGRRTYEEFARFWPKQGDDVPFAALNNSISKIAVSGTLEHADWHNTRVIRDGDIEQVKRDASGDLHITGSATLVRSWIERAIIDEAVLVVFPTVRGTGHRLFAGSPQADLALRDVQRFPHGVLALTYVRRK